MGRFGDRLCAHSTKLVQMLSWLSKSGSMAGT